MWKKKENEVSTPPAVPEPEKPERRISKPNPTPRSERAVIGPTVRIKGEVAGEEDLVVQGEIEGKIEVRGRGVTIGKSGRVRADVHARSIRVEGRVRGDLFGEQEIVIEAEGDVEGNLVAPSVRLENGSRFKGSIDMEQSTPPIPAHPGSGPSQVSGGPQGARAADLESKRNQPPTPTGPGQMSS
ncbi:MAG: polymer-forming cytoskeletal protein [Acidobacteriota bacterium]